MMRRLSEFARLPGTDQRLVMEAGLWVAAIRVALWVAPLVSLRGMLRRLARATRIRRPISDSQVPAIGWAVRTASRYVPGAACLVQALAAEALLLRRNLPSVLRIGVARHDTGPLVAHAWTESNGQIVVGGPEPGLQYTVLLGTNRAAPDSG